MRETIYWLLPLLLAGVLIRSGWAGAWPQEKGGYFFKLSASYLSTDKEFNFQGETIPILGDFPGYGNVRFRDLVFSFYGEYGITSRLTGIVSLPFKRSTNEREQQLLPSSSVVKRTTTGFADLQLLLRYGVLFRPVALSLQGGIKIPLGYEEFPENDGPSLGTARTDAEISLLLGKSWFPLPLYSWLGAGYRTRGGRFHDEWLFSAELGLTTGPLLLKVTVDGVKNVIRPPDIYGQTLILPLPGGGGAFQQFQFGDQDYIKINPGLIVELVQPLAVQIEVIHFLWGRNVLAGTQASAGLVLHR